MLTKKFTFAAANALCVLLSFCSFVASAVAQSLVLSEQEIFGPTDPQPTHVFGWDFSVSGNLLAGGAHGDSTLGVGAGAAYVFERTGAGWTQIVKLTASDGAADAAFGLAVSLSGNTLAVGAIGDMDYRGAVYIFERIGDTWQEFAKLTASDADMVDGFGAAVALEGNRLVVAAPYDDEAGLDAGAAYVFQFDGTSWNEVQKLMASDALPGLILGDVVGLSGDRFIAGAPGQVIGLQGGAVYVYHWDGITWNEEQKLTQSGGTQYVCFGQSAAINEDRIAVGARCTFNGSVYMFERLPTGWVMVQEVTATPAIFDSCFGFDVALSNTRMAIGAQAAVFTGVGEVGAAYVFDLTPAGWVQLARLMSSDAETESGFGRTVAVSGPDVLVSAMSHTGSGPPNAGAVFVYSLRPHRRGDVNADGFVNIADAISILTSLFVSGSSPAVCSDTADSNDDGVINIADAVFELSSLFVAGSPSLPEPITCGIDPTSDFLDCDEFSPCP